MPHRCSTSNRLVAGMAAVVLTIGAVMPADAGTATGAATEWTQVLNNGELVSLVGQSGEQIQNQLTQTTFGSGTEALNISRPRFDILGQRNSILWRAWPA